MALSIDIDVTFWFGIDDDWLGIGRNFSDLPFDIGVFEADHSTLKNDALVKFILSKFSKDEATEIKTIECRLRKPKMVIVRSKEVRGTVVPNRVHEVSGGVAEVHRPDAEHTAQAQAA